MVDVRFVVDKLIRIKTQELNLKLFELNEIKYEIELLEKEKSEIENSMNTLNHDISSYEEYISNLVSYQRLNKHLKDVNSKLKELYDIENALSEQTKDIMRDIKALEIIKHNRHIEHVKKELYKEELNASFFYNLKHFYIVLLLFLVFNMKTFGAPALYNSASNTLEQNINAQKQDLNILIDQKLQNLEQQKKELQALIKQEQKLKKEQEKKKEEEIKKKQEKEQEIQKYIQVIASSDSDQAGAMLNDVDPEIAAKILVMLPSRKAGSVLSAMDPKKAALVTQYIIAHKKELNAMKQEINKTNNQPASSNQITPQNINPQNTNQSPPPPG